MSFRFPREGDFVYSVFPSSLFTSNSSSLPSIVLYDGPTETHLRYFFNKKFISYFSFTINFCTGPSYCLPYGKVKKSPCVQNRLICIFFSQMYHVYTFFFFFEFQIQSLLFSVDDKILSVEYLLPMGLVSLFTYYPFGSWRR